MRFSIQDGALQNPQLHKLIPGTMVVIGSTVYIKVDKQKGGAATSKHVAPPKINWIADYCVVIDPVSGKLYQFCADTRVQVVATFEKNVPVKEITSTSELQEFLHNKY